MSSTPSRDPSEREMPQGHGVTRATFERADERGLFVEAINGGHWENLIYGKMKKDTVMGNHFHKKTQVFFFLIDGQATIKTVAVETGARDEVTIRRNEGVTLVPLESHSIRFLEDSTFVMLKSIAYDPDAPDTYHYPVDES